MMSRHVRLAHNDAGRPPIAFTCSASNRCLALGSLGADGQQKNSWDSAIETLAAKIAAIAGAHASIRLNVKNISSLDAGRVADFISALEAQLHQRGLKAESAETADETFDVTISENLRDIIFVATTKRGESQEIAMETLDRAKGGIEKRGRNRACGCSES